MPDFEKYLIFNEIDKDTDVNSFICEKEDLNDFLYEKALNNNQQCLSKVYLLENTSNNEIVGYIALSTYRANIGDARLFGMNNVPSILLGRIAIDNKYRGYDLGKKYLLKYATAKSNIVKNHVGCRLLIAEVEREDKRFYKYCLKIGFKDLRENKRFSFLYIDLL